MEGDMCLVMCGCGPEWAVCCVDVLGQRRQSGVFVPLLGQGAGESFFRCFDGAKETGGY